MRILLCLIAALLWVAPSPKVHAGYIPASCDQLEPNKALISRVVLGCLGSGIDAGELAELEAKGYPWDFSEIFDDLPKDEQLLARLNFIIPLQTHPSQKEVRAHMAPKFNAGAGSLSVADLLTINASWSYDISMFFRLLELSAQAEKMGPLHKHILDATLLEVAGHYQQDYLNNGTVFVDTQAVIGGLQDSRVPWSKTVLAAQHLEYGWGVQDAQIALDLYLSNCCATPTMTVVAGLLAENDSDWLRDISAEAFIHASDWAKAGNIFALSWYDSIANAAPKFSGAPTVSYDNLLLTAARYGVPSLKAQVGWGFLGGDGPLGQDIPRGEELLREAAEAGVDTPRDWYIDDLLRQGEYEEAFRYSLVNAAEGYLTVKTFGFQLAYMLSKMIYTDEEAQKWQEFLAFQCKNAPITWEDTSKCPPSRTDKSFVLLAPHELVAARTDDIREQGSYALKTGEYHAVLLANSEYDSWPGLSTPDEDIAAVEAILREKYGFKTQTVLNGDRREMLKAIYDVGKNVSFGDHVMVYYAGHGVIDRNSDVAYWIPSDGGRDFAPDWVSAQEVMNAFKTIPAKHLLLVADSCYSGKLLRGSAQSEPVATESVVRRLFQKKARVALTSGGEEPVADSSSGSTHSVFAQAFLDSLEENGSPLPASTLYDMVLTHVSAEASQTPQYSDMRELGHDGGDFIFVPSAW